MWFRKQIKPMLYAYHKSCIGLQILRNGFEIANLEQADAINSGDQTFISLLANECPYIAGTAVYKARSIFAIYEPGKMFDDMNLCNQFGVYKNSNDNGQGIFDQENEYLNSLFPISNNSITEPNNFNIYPNPATTQLTIDYHLQPFEEGSITIYDIMGRECFFINLNTSANKAVVNVSDLKSGIYTYKYTINNISRRIGKLLIK